MSSPTPTVSLTEKLDSAHELRSSAVTASMRTRRVSWHTRWWKPLPLGLFRALVPTSAGGEDRPWPTWMRVEELSTVDGAVGWNAGVGSAANAIVSGWVSADIG